MTERMLKPSQGNLCSAARAVALLVAIGLCCRGGDVLAQFRAESDLGAGDNVQGAVATFATSTAVGNSATASGAGSTALGQTSLASGSSSTALGAGSQALQTNSTAVGNGANAFQISSTALGDSVTANGTNSTALGQSSEALATNSTALGQDSEASGIDSTALGQGSTAAFTNSTAIGFSATTTRNDQMMFGTATNTYTAPGITSAASRTAQTGALQLMTTDASGNLASDSLANLGIASTAAVQTNTTNIAQNRQDIRQNTEGVAMAMALSGIPTVLPVDTTYAVSANWGSFGSENAIAVGGSVALTNYIFLNGGGTVGTGGRGNGGGRAGFTIAW